MSYSYDFDWIILLIRDCTMSYAADFNVMLSEILSAMKWDVIPKGLQKTNVNHRISTSLSATRQVKKEEAKDPNYSPTDGDEDSSDVGKQPHLKKRKEDDLILNDDDTDELLNTSFDL